MKQLLCTFLAISHLLTTTSFCLPQTVDEMEIVDSTGKYISVKYGTAHGIEIGDFFKIYSYDTWSSSEIEIGLAQVIKVQENVAVLEPIEIEKGYSVGKGDKLRRTTNFVVEPRPQEFSKEKVGQQVNYNLKGMEQADLEYSGSGALVGGLFAGFLLGLIGWLIGWAIVANSEMKVPSHHLTNLDENQRVQFSLGYKEAAKKRKVSKFHTGAAIGTLTIVVIFLAANSGS